MSAYSPAYNSTLPDRSVRVIGLPVIRRRHRHLPHHHEHHDNLFILFFLLLLLLVLAGCGAKITGPDGEGWLFERIATGREMGLHSSIGVTSTGSVNLAYYDARNHGLYHAVRDPGGQWSTTQVDTPGWVGQYVEQYVSPDGEIHLVYQDVDGRKMRFSVRDSLGWRSGFVDFSFQYSQGQNPRILNTTQGLYLFEFIVNGPGSRIGLWQLIADQWSFVFDNPISMDTLPDVSFGPDGLSAAIIRRITESGFANPSYLGYRVIHLSCGDGSGPWSEKEIAVENLPISPRAYCPQSVAVAYDDTGISHVIYRNEQRTLVDTATGSIQTGMSNDLIRSFQPADGNPAILYRNGSNLSVAVWETGGSWTRLPPIEGVNPEGRWDLCVDPDGIVHVSVYSGSRQELLYAYRQKPL